MRKVLGPLLDHLGLLSDTRFHYFDIFSRMMLASDIQEIRSKMDTSISEHMLVISSHEAEILKHQHAIADIRIELNKLAPISRLPPEILLEVFIIYADICRLPVRNLARKDKIPRNAWLRVTHICHAWRTLAISYPRLWTHIDILRSDAVKEWLHRSKSLPLDVSNASASSSTTFGRLPAARRIEALLLALQESHRIRNLEIRYPRFAVGYETFELAWQQRRTTMLQSVALTTHFDWYGPKGGTPIITRLLRGMPERLERLELTDSYLLCKDLMYPDALKFLKQCKWTSRGPWAETIPEILGVLGASPLLEALHLQDMEPGVDPMRDMSLVPVIHLPNLRTLWLGSRPLPALTLFSKLSFPHTATVEMKFTPDGNLPSQLESLRPLVAKCLTGAGTDGQYFPMVTFSVEGRGCDNVDFRMWKTAQPYQAIQEQNSDLLMSFDIYEVFLTWSQWVTILQSVLGSVDIPHVRIFHIGAMHRYAFITDFRLTLSGMSGMEVLHVTGWTSRELLRLIYTRKEQHSEHVFLPNLRTIHLHNVSFPHHPRQESDVTELGYLMERLQTRRDRGSPVETLVLDRCYNLIPEDIETMRETVRELCWDGVEEMGDPVVWRPPEPDEFDEDDADWDAVNEIEFDDD